jgi:hypothetical protein
MSLYLTILFIHVGSALVLAAALGVDWMLLVLLRRASSVQDAHSWLEMWTAVSWVASLSLLVLLVTGGYMVGRFGQWPLAWPKAALVALVLIGAFGGISSKRMRAARKACGAAVGMGDSECLRLLRNPILKISVNTRIALLFAAVLLMTMTPGIYASSAIAGGVLVGVLVSLIGSSPKTSPKAVEAGRQSD